MDVWTPLDVEEFNAIMDAFNERQSYEPRHVTTPMLLVLCGYAEEAARRNDPATGERLMNRVKELATRGDFREIAPIIEFTRGSIALASGDVARAEKTFRTVIGMAGDPGAHARDRAHANLGMLAWLRDERREALRHFEAALPFIARCEGEVKSAFIMKMAVAYRDANDPAGELYCARQLGAPQEVIEEILAAVAAPGARMSDVMAVVTRLRFFGETEAANELLRRWRSK